MVVRARKKKKAGRPAHKPTASTRKRVEILRTDGWSYARICHNMGIDEKTLTKHYAMELQFGDDKTRGELLVVVYDKALTGNISAARAFDTMTKGAAPPPDPGRTQVAHDVENAVPAEKVGKKELANLEAVTAAEGTSWGNLIKH